MAEGGADVISGFRPRLGSWIVAVCVCGDFCQPMAGAEHKSEESKTEGCDPHERISLIEKGEAGWIRCEFESGNQVLFEHASS